MKPKNETTLEYDGIIWLLKRMPPAPQFIELFGQNVAVSVSREPRGVDTINDPTNSVRAFFTAVRDHENELVKRITDDSVETILERVPQTDQIDPTHDLIDDHLTTEALILGRPNPSSDVVDQAAAFFIRSGGLNPVRNLASTPGRWTFHIERPGSLSQPTDHETLLARIHDVTDRLRRIQIEHEPLVDAIDRNDDEDAFFFATVPPAITSTDAGGDFASAFQDLDGKCALATSSWKPEELSIGKDWRVESIPSTLDMPGDVSPTHLYCNYEIERRELEFDIYTPAIGPENGAQVGLGRFSEDTEDKASIPLPPGGSVSIRGGKVLPFRWYGGKFNHLEWLLELLPETDTFVEPFGGSGAVLLNRSPSDTEVYNDIDEEVTSFFRVLKGDGSGSKEASYDGVQTARLIRNIALSPFSRAELAAAAAQLRDDTPVSAMERARQFFVRAGQTRSGLAQEASPGRWAYCKSTSRRTMSGAVSRWHGRLDHLYRVAERLKTVDIRNEDALKVIREYGDDPDTLIYCDPPYPHETRGDTNSYGFELDENQHRNLAAVLKDCKAKVALSSYKSELYQELYEKDGWYRFDSKEQTMHTTKDTRIESVWMNYKPPSVDSSKLYKAD